MAGKRILILGGTSEAVDIAARIKATGTHAAITSLAGVTRNPQRPPGLVRSGGFGGAAGLACYLREQRIAAVIDATHPFAGRISRHAAQAAAMARLPLLHILRPAWRRVPGDVWHDVRDTAAAAAWLDAAAFRDGAAIFLTIGRTRIDALAGIGRFRFLLRAIEAPDPASLPPRCDIILGRGPFDEAAERTLLRDRGIACLVTRNSGGSSGYAKVAAARALAVPVLMIARPDPPPGPAAATAEAALDWLDAL